MRKVPFPMDEPLVMPDLETGTNGGRMETPSSLNSGFVVVALDVVGPVDVVAVIDEVDTVQSHDAFPGSLLSAIGVSRLDVCRRSVGSL